MTNINNIRESEDFEWMNQSDNVVDSDYLIYSDDDSMGVANPLWLDDSEKEWMFNGEVKKIIEFTVRYPKGIDGDKITEIVYEIYDDIINNDMDISKVNTFFNVEDGKNVVYIDEDTIIKEQEEEFDWIKDVVPRSSTDINVGDYFYIIKSFPTQKTNRPLKVRYILKVIDIYDEDGVEYMYNLPLVLDDFFEDGIETFYDEDSGEYYSHEEDIPPTEEYINDVHNHGLDQLPMDRVRSMIEGGYWVYTDNVHDITEYMSL